MDRIHRRETNNPDMGKGPHCRLPDFDVDTSCVTLGGWFSLSLSIFSDAHHYTDERASISYWEIINEL